MENKFALVVVSEREVLLIQLFPTKEEAVEGANQALENWLIAGINIAPDMDDDDLLIEEGEEWQRATVDSLCAWSNYRSNWDAHVIDMSDPALSIDIFAP